MLREQRKPDQEAKQVRERPTRATGAAQGLRCPSCCPAEHERTDEHSTFVRDESKKIHGRITNRAGMPEPRPQARWAVMKLQGFRVVDLTVFLPGPQLTLALADHGADRPHTGHRKFRAWATGTRYCRDTTP